MVSSHQGMNLPDVIAIGNLSHIGFPPDTIKAKVLSTSKQEKIIKLSQVYEICLEPHYLLSIQSIIVAQNELKMKKIRKVQIHNSKIKEGR